MTYPRSKVVYLYEDECGVVCKYFPATMTNCFLVHFMTSFLLRVGPSAHCSLRINSAYDIELYRRLS